MSLDYKKIEELRKLAAIPYRDGEQFIDVNLNLVWSQAGTIRFGFKWKTEMGEQDFSSIDEAIGIVKGLRKRARL